MESKKRQLLIAVVVFVLTLFFSRAYIERIRSELTPQKLISVAVASTTIAAGDRLTADRVQWVEVPANYAPRTAIDNETDLKSFIGQESGVNIPNGDYILKNYFAERTAVSSKLSGLISGKNLRAINLPVDESNSMARSILPNDRVDIIFTFQVPGTPDKMSVILLQNVQVLSTGTYSAAERERGLAEEGARRYNSLTLLLPAQDAVRLNYARQVGQISVMLRGPADLEGQTFPSITSVEDILTAEDKERVSSAVAKRVAAQSNTLADDRFREQLRQLFELRRQQGDAPSGGGSSGTATRVK